MSNEYYAVVLEFNSREIKLGFVGESSEHVKVNCESPLWKKLVPPSKSTSSSPAFLSVDSHSIPADFRNDIIQNIDKSKVYNDLVQAYLRDKKDSKWYDWDLDNYLTLATIVKVLLSTKLLIQPLKTKFFVVDQPISAARKSLFCKTFLSTNTAVSLTFLPYSPCCCVAAGVESALIVSLDWESCKLVPVLDLRSLPAAEFIQYSGESIHYSPTMRHDDIGFEELELQIQDNKINVEKELFSDDGLSVAIAAFMRSLNVDLRACVMRNIIFTGLRSKIPGVKGRILTEIAGHFPSLNISGKISLGPWVGASLYCSTTLLKLKSTEWKHMEISKTSLDKTAASALERYDL